MKQISIPAGWVVVRCCYFKNGATGQSNSVQYLFVCLFIFPGSRANHMLAHKGARSSKINSASKFVICYRLQYSNLIIGCQNYILQLLCFLALYIMIVMAVNCFVIGNFSFFPLEIVIIEESSTI